MYSVKINLETMAGSTKNVLWAGVITLGGILNVKTIGYDSTSYSCISITRCQIVTVRDYPDF